METHDNLEYDDAVFNMREASAYLTINEPFYVYVPSSDVVDSGGKFFTVLNPQEQRIQVIAMENADENVNGNPYFGILRASDLHQDENGNYEARVLAPQFRQKIGTQKNHHGSFSITSGGR